MNYPLVQNGRVELFRRALVIGLGAQLITVPALLAQNSASAPAEMKKQVVTGSLIPTADTVGVAPVETITSADLQKVGGTDILTALKALSPSFVGSGNIGQTLNNGGFGESFIAIRNLPTLILLDGKRVNISAFSTYVGTYSVDLNTIPVAMVDRIEVLKDGASTLYGSDAIGGVVNIITKKDFNGVEVSGRYGFGLGKGVYNEARGSAVLGYSKDNTRLTVGANYYYSDPIYTGSRGIGSLSVNDLAAAGLNAPSYISGNYPGRAGSFVLAGSPLAVGASGYRAGLVTPPLLTGGPFTSIAAYNAAALQQVGYAPYIPISSTPPSQALGGSATVFDTTQLHPVTVQRQDRRNIVANLEQDLFQDHLTFYAQLLYSKNESLGQLAPAPVSSLGLYNLFVPDTNPYNPFGVSTGLGAPVNLGIRTRLIETGNRQFNTDSDSLHGVAGIKGDVFEKYHYDISVDYSRTQQTQFQNSASSPALNLAMTPLATGSSLSQLKDASGNNVPLYNIFALPGFNNPQTIKAISASGFQTGFSDLIAVDGAFRGEIFDLPAGPLQMAAGGQYIGESLSLTADPLLSSGNLIGLGSYPVFPGGNRDRVAGFVEASIPVFSPQQNIPGLYRFDLSASGRIEHVDSLNNSKSSAVPKAGFRWQPFDDQLTIAGTYSQGFVVPGLTQLYGPAVSSDPYIVLPDDTNGFKPSATQNGQVNFLSNPDLPPSMSETFTTSITYSPKQIKNLTLGFSYYHINETDVAFYPTATGVAADLNKNGAASTWVNNPNLHGAPIYIDQNNNPYVPTAGVQSTYINASNVGVFNLPLMPGGAERTDGFDVTGDYLLDAGAAGTVRFFASANILLSYEIKLPGGSQYYNYKGQYTDTQAVAAPQGLIPDYNISAGFTWSFKNLDYTVIAHYLPGVIDLGDTHPSVAAPSNDFTASGATWKVPSYYKIDMQLAYTFKSAEKKWYDNTRVAVGMNNVTDEKPRLIASSSEDNTDKSSYDILGRFVYIEVSKKF